MRWFGSRQQRDRDLDDEIASHFRMAVAERIARGESTAEAEAAVHREFGNELLVREVTRSMWRGAGVERLLQEFRIALRTLWRTPRFTLAAISCIAIGVGVTTTIFSALHGILLRPLPYPNANTLISIRAQSIDGAAHDESITPGEMKTWSRARTFTQLGAWQTTFADFTGPEDTPERVASAYVSPEVFQLLGVAPLHGRWLEAHDATWGAPPVVVLSHEIWRRRYGEDRGIVGRTIELYRRPYVVAGVMPPGFSFPGGALTWTPAGLPPDLPDDVLFFSGVIARVAPRATPAQVRSEFAVLNRELGTRYPNWKFSVVSLRDELVGALRKPVLLFQGAALLVLLIACANVAALLLARGSSRQRELAVRAAIGAGQARLIGHVLIESITLGLLGGAAGVLVAFAGVRLIALGFPNGVPSYIKLGIQAPVLGFSVAIALLCAIGFGLAPAIRAGRTRSSAALQTAARATSAHGREHRRGRESLIAAEIALTVILVVFANLLVRSELLLRRSLGFRSDGVLTVRVPVPLQFDRYKSDEARRSFYRRLRERLQALPGVESVSASHLPAPLDGDATGSWDLIINDVPARPDDRTRASLLYITPNYLGTLRIPVLAGRNLNVTDTSTVQRAVLVNETFVHRYFPAGHAVGSRMRVDRVVGKVPPMRIVGVIADFRHQRPPGEILPTVYLNNDLSIPSQTFLLRTRLADPSTLGTSIRSIVRELDPTLVTYRLQTQSRLVERSFWRERLQGRVVSVFAFLALLLAVFGMYGVLSYAVAQRTAELGVRVALGASPRQLLLLMLGQAARVGLAGVTIGVVIAIAASRLMSGLLYGVSPTDPRGLLGAAILLLVVAVLAAILPARRAAGLDPATAIRLG